MATRTENYEQGIQPAQITALLTAGKTGMIARLTPWINKMAVVYATMCAVLAGEAAIKTVEYAHYYGYCNEIGSLLERIPGGDPVQAEASALTDKWVALGLNDTVCKAVALACFGITIA